MNLLDTIGFIFFILLMTWVIGNILNSAADCIEELREPRKPKGSWREYMAESDRLRAIERRTPAITK